MISMHTTFWFSPGGGIQTVSGGTAAPSEPGRTENHRVRRVNACMTPGRGSLEGGNWSDGRVPGTCCERVHPTRTVHVETWEPTRQYPPPYAAHPRNGGNKPATVGLRLDVNHYRRWAFIEAATAICATRQRVPKHHFHRLTSASPGARAIQRLSVPWCRILAEVTYWLLSKQEPYREPRSAAVSSNGG